MPVAMLAVVGALFWILFARRAASAPVPAIDAERLLDVRYACGEIDDDEYRHRLTVLRGADHAVS
jgi:uncharacterized membrane protein